MDTVTGFFVFIGLLTIGVLGAVVIERVTHFIWKINAAANAVQVSEDEYKNPPDRFYELEQSVADFKRRFEALDKYVDTSKYAMSVRAQQAIKWQPILDRIDEAGATAEKAMNRATQALAAASEARGSDDATYDEFRQHVIDGHPVKDQKGRG